MKRLLVAFSVLCAIALASTSSAAPLLVCDPYAADVGVQGFRGTVNGVAFDIPYALTPDGTAAIVYDCAALGNGKWDFQNVRAYNARGESSGVPFVYPALPGAPSNIRLK